MPWTPVYYTTDGTYGTLDATNNWWGSNGNPLASVHNATYSPWLIMNFTAIPPGLTTAQTSALRVNITNNSARH